MKTYIQTTIVLLAVLAFMAGPADSVWAGGSTGPIDGSNGSIPYMSKDYISVPKGRLFDVIAVPYYVLVDRGNQWISVQVDFTSNNGLTWSPATEFNAPYMWTYEANKYRGKPNAVQVFFWDSEADLGRSFVPSCKLRFTPRDSKTFGEPFVTKPFMVRNYYLKRQQPARVNAQVESISPDSGGYYGDIKVTIKGKNFGADSFVYIGSNLARDLRVVNSTTLTCRIPEIYHRTWDDTLPVTVKNSEGRSEGYVTFTYKGRPADTPVYSGVVGASNGNDDEVKKEVTKKKFTKKTKKKDPFTSIWDFFFRR